MKLPLLTATEANDRHGCPARGDQWMLLSGEDRSRWTCKDCGLVLYEYPAEPFAPRYEIVREGKP